MGENLIDRRSLSRVIIEDLGDQVTSRLRDLILLREVVGVHTNTLVGGLDISGLEWRLANDQSVDDNADGPDVDLVLVTLLTFEHLRRNIVRSTADSALSLAIELQFGSQTEVTDLDFHFVVNEEIAELQITVDHAMRVHVLDS